MAANGNTIILNRPVVKDTVTIPASAQVPTTGLHHAGFVGGVFFTPSALTSTSIGFDSSYDGGSTWVTVCEDSGAGLATKTAIAITVATNAAECHKLPDELAFAPLWRFNTSDNEGAARTIYVFRGS